MARARRAQNCAIVTLENISSFFPSRLKLSASFDTSEESLTALSSVHEATSTSTSTRRIFYEREQGVLGIAKTAKRLARAHSTLITRFVCNLNVRRCCWDFPRYIYAVIRMCARASVWEIIHGGQLDSLYLVSRLLLLSFTVKCINELLNPTFV